MERKAEEPIYRHSAKGSQTQTKSNNVVFNVLKNTINFFVRV